MPLRQTELGTVTRRISARRRSCLGVEINRAEAIPHRNPDLVEGTHCRDSKRHKEVREENSLAAGKRRYSYRYPYDREDSKKKEGLVRNYREKRTKYKYKYLRAQLASGECVEIDVKYVPGAVAGRPYFQYTAVDRASRWRHLEIYDEQINLHSVLFLEEVIRRAPFAILSIKTDNHATFTNYYTGTNKRSDLLVKSLHALDVTCRERGIKHYLIDPGKPAQNGTVERSHREDQEKLYDQTTFQS